ncbi:MAG TPA: threonine/serine dehydratase [Jiangellales bacterium]|nr:threonine/serine dehydratase [Jiangellales bacterium]
MSGPSPLPHVTVEDVRAAAERIRGAVVRTPLLPCPWAPGRLLLKPESLQPTGAFKLRGATNAVASLDPEARARGVLTHSSGNHAQALAWAARAYGVPAVVVMPLTSPAVKVEATRALGAEVVLVEPADRVPTAERLRAERGLALVPPFDHAEVIAGQGTVGLEIVEDLPGVDTVLVPVGGGGLAAGVAVAVAALAPRARVVGVEPALAADFAESVARGERVTWDVEQTGRTVADGVRLPSVGEITWAHLRTLVHEVVTVDEDALLEATALLARRSRLVVEPSGALAVAGHLARPDRPGTTVAVVSGGNVDPALLAGLLVRTTPT